MSDIRQWLEDLGLGQYADAFEAEQIVLDHVPELTDADLGKLGLSMGPRKAVLKAARSLGDSENGADGKRETRTGQAHLPDAHPREAERRQLTVMFCDLVGSTALSEKLDPEDLRDVMAAYQKTAGAVIERYEGHVAQYLGDGVMIYFGWPKAHEDDAQRAIRAGLEIVEAVGEIEAPELLSVRVGISTGPVVVGETGAGDASVPKAAVGETPNLAARVQGLAEPNTVAIAEVTCRLIGGAFELEYLGQRELKGFDGTIGVYRVLGESVVESRFEASHAAGLTPLVGRASELSLVMERWQQARGGEGQVLLLSGEAGIGKSRITQALRERVMSEPHTHLRYQCSPYYTNSAFYPVIDQLERAAGFARNDDLDAKLDKLEALLAQSADNMTDIAPLFAALLSLPLDRHAPLNLSSQKQKENTIAALADQVALLAREQPVLMIFEDAHWIDPTTLETLSAVINRIQDAAVLLVITYRPEFEPPWASHGHVTLHSLNRLGRRQGAEMVARITGGTALPNEVLDQIVAKTDGVPLFVEELTKTVLEAGFLRRTETNYILDGPLPPLAIPATLQDSLMARLDRLPAVKEVAQSAACFGREFSFAMLAAVSQLDDHALADALSQLSDSALIIPTGTPPNAVYIFRHALVQETAYESLLKSRRRLLHLAIAKMLPQQFPATVETQPEIMAHHCDQAGLAEQAALHWQKAADRALQHGGNPEAIANLTKGLAAIRSVERSDDAKRTECTILVSLGAAHLAVYGYGSKEARDVYVKASDLSREIGDEGKLFEITFGLHVYYISNHELVEAERSESELMMLADRKSDLGMRIQGHHAVWGRAIVAGEVTVIAEHAGKAIELYDRERHQSHKFLYGAHDPAVCGCTARGWANWMLGYPDKALASATEGVSLARTLSHPPSLAQGLSLACWTANVRNEPDRIMTMADEGIPLSEEYGLPAFLGRGKIMRGWALAALGNFAEGVDELRHGIQIYRKATHAGLTYYNGLLADALARAGKLGEASLKVGEALAFAEQNGERMWVSGLYYLRGKLLKTQGTGRFRDAETCFVKAREEAQKQRAKSMELRAVTALAQLWNERGDRQAAHDLLTPVYDLFTEGFDSADL
ncbi:MAG: AAA family ATPase [Gammaproteobacteria bacterium]|nr:AAA family ATPase [Gammaproteobacteria bacterium]